MLAVQALTWFTHALVHATRLVSLPTLGGRRPFVELIDQAKWLYPSQSFGSKRDPDRTARIPRVSRLLCTFCQIVVVDLLHDVERLLTRSDRSNHAILGGFDYLSDTKHLFHLSSRNEDDAII